ncbi:MAG: thiamine phosphate synthase [Phycisphaerales bacterium JB052]
MPRFDVSMLRMLDANLNRAREGLRVMEDCARFVLNDAQLSERLKQARHALKSALSSLSIDAISMLGVRNTAGDVGTSISTPTEQSRTGGLRDMVNAAAKRSCEALRVIEESAKVLGQSGAPFESIRYTIYDIERDLLLALNPTCPQWSLCVLITNELCTHHAAGEVIELAAAGGADCVQLREKTMPDRAFLEHAGRLTDLAHNLGMHVMINDRVQIAKLVGADGVHLGQDDLPIDSARSLLGPGFWIGRTCPTIEHAFEAVEQGADTCGLGPVFPSTTKSKTHLAGKCLIESYLNDPRTESTPMLAISGIDAQNIDSLARIGCPGVAVSSAVCSSPDPESVCRAIVESILHHREAGDATISS